MDEQLSDKTVILIIIGTILLIFLLIFTFIPSNNELSPSIQWKDTQANSINNLET